MLRGVVYQALHRNTIGRCAIFGFISWPEKITRCIIAHFVRYWVCISRTEKLQVYAPQTKLLDGRTLRRTNIRERIFKALFTYVSTRFGRRSFEKCFENAFLNVCSAVQNLRLGSIKLHIAHLAKSVLKGVVYRTR